MATTKKTETVETEVKAEEKEPETVKMMIPYIEGEDPEETVIVNGETIKIIKGEMVDVSLPYAKVLMNRDKQLRAFGQYKKSIQMQEIG